MPRILIADPAPVRPEVFPEDGVARDGLEDDARRGFSCKVAFRSALDKMTPLRVIAPEVKERELGPTTLDTIGSHPYHEAARSPPATHVGAPVEVVIVVAARHIALSPQPLYPELILPALKSAGSALDASHGICPGDEGDLRLPDCGVSVGGFPVIGNS